VAWQKGESGNPGGRPPLTIELQEVKRLCQERSMAAYERVAELMDSADKDSTRLAAALAILKMAGMPMNAEVSVTINQPPPPPAHVPAETLEAGLGPSELN
jgi:hypothetical protein